MAYEDRSWFDDRSWYDKIMDPPMMSRLAVLNGLIGQSLAQGLTPLEMFGGGVDDIVTAKLMAPGSGAAGAQGGLAGVLATLLADQGFKGGRKILKGVENRHQSKITQLQNQDAKNKARAIQELYKQGKPLDKFK